MANTLNGCLGTGKSLSFCIELSSQAYGLVGRMSVRRAVRIKCPMRNDSVRPSSTR
jgi:hypothetical protein